jgi:glucose-6-phosphate isomerase
MRIVREARRSAGGDRRWRCVEWYCKHADFDSRTVAESARRELCKNDSMTSRLPGTPITTPAWRALAAHAASLGSQHLRDVVASRTRPPAAFSLRLGPLLVSFARQRLDDTTLSLLLALGHERGLAQHIAALLSGAAVNASEGRPALHTALRAADDAPDPTGAAAQARAERRRMLAFAADLGAGRVAGDGAAIDTVVNIGIGGSDLGPRLVVDALYEYRRPDLRVEFVSNLDGHAMHRCLLDLDPARTLFIVASKSFGTIETLTNAVTARHWLEQHDCRDVRARFAAVTANPAAATAFGIAPERVFRLWDWVGGRYSVWSSVALPVAAAVGERALLEFLGGARRVDDHFATAPPEHNLPVVLGLVDTWNAACLGSPTRAVIPYDQRLQLLPAYLSQLIMESNGKSVDNRGLPLTAASSPIVWGGVGTDAQHAFFQLLHQGMHTVPVEFLVAARPRHYPEHHRLLLAACLAQGQALMAGRVDADRPWRTTHGDQPSSTILYDDLTPETLGMLLALYEHRTFVHAALLDMNPFDQWGVELGKEMARDIAHEMERGGHASADPVTRQLLDHCMERDAPA